MRFDSPLAMRDLRAPRRDGRALGFGFAFLVSGGALLARAAGLGVSAVWLFPIVLLSLGAAGLVKVGWERRR
jgi:hypothetical protein